VFHGGVRPVIGNIINYGISWSAVCAIDERIPEPPVLLIEKLPEAIITNGYIRRDKG